MKKPEERRKENTRKEKRNRRRNRFSFAYFSTNIPVRAMLNCLFYLQAWTCVDIHGA
jgi:hypothetical protein